LKHQKFFVPLVDDLFWVGSTYQWHFENAYPSKEKRAELETYLKENLKIPYQIEDHLAAVRPSTKDRRPFFGRHSVYENVYMFNGLGTKGFSLAPYWSEYLIDLMFGNRQILHPDLPIIS
jgi:glycine/D-amino acid oxidase-like deaminating enzyme